MAKKNFFSKIRVSYNAPATLTFAILSALILFFNQLLSGNLIPALFTAPGSATCKVSFNFSSFLDYVRLFTHVLGHSDWNHFLSNMAFILLLGPVIEERYGSPIVVLMMSITALVTGVLNACFSPTQLLGSSDIAFMMILLTSFTSITKKEIPLSFILVLVLYIGREILNSGINQNISTLAHIAGGICGSLFAFLATPRPKTAKDGKEIIIDATVLLPTANQIGDKDEDEKTKQFSPCHRLCASGCNSGLSFFESHLQKDFKPILEEVFRIIEENHLVNRLDREYEEEIVTKAGQLSSYLKNCVISYPVPIDNEIAKDVIYKKTPEVQDAIEDSLRRSRTLSKEKREHIQAEKEKYYRKRDTKISQIVNILNDSDLEAILRRTDRRITDGNDMLPLS